MARELKRKVSSAPSAVSVNSTEKKKYTAAELNEWYAKQDERIKNFEAAQEAFKRLKDITKNATKSIRTFSKDLLRTYMKNPGSNENNLRSLSWYLYYRSMPYMRVCNFYPNILELKYRSVIPEYNINSPKSASMKKSMVDTDDRLSLWHLDSIFRDIALTCMIQDMYFGIWIEDDTGLFVWQIPPQYAKIAGKYFTGDFSIAMDMSYVRAHQELLEYLSEPLQQMYDEYLRTNQKWVMVPDKYSIAVKFRCDDPDTILPPLLPAFNEIIDLADLEDTQATADALSIYKMIWLEMETLNGTDMPNDWKVDTQLQIEYFNRMVEEALPEYISAAIVPGKLQTISFDDQADKDVNKVLKSTETLLNSMGSAEVLNGATISGAEAFRTAQIVSSNFILKPMLPQFSAITNRHLSYSLSNPSKVIYHEVSSLTKSYFDEKVLSLAQNGVPSKTLLGTTLGYSVKDTLAMNYIEEEVLGLSDLFRPLSTSYTQSSKDLEGGRPKETRSDSGDESAEKRDKANG